MPTKKVGGDNYRPAAKALMGVVRHVMGTNITFLDRENKVIKKPDSKKEKPNINDIEFTINDKRYKISDLSKSDYLENKDLFDLLFYSFQSKLSTGQFGLSRSIQEIAGRSLADKIKKIRDIDTDQLGKDIKNRFTGEIYLNGKDYKVEDLDSDTIEENFSSIKNILDSKRQAYLTTLRDPRRKEEANLLKIYESLSNKLEEYCKEMGISFESKSTSNIFQDKSLSESIVSEDSDILRKLNIRKRTGGSPEFANINKENIEKFLRIYTGDKETKNISKIIDYLFSGSTKDREIASLARKIVDSKGKLSGILPRDPSYGFSDYFLYDTQNPSLDNRVGISIKGHESGGYFASLEGFKSTFSGDYDISRPLNTEVLERKAINRTKMYLRSFNEDENRAQIINSMVSLAMSKKIYGDLSEEKVRSIIKHKMKKEALQAFRAFVLLKTKKFKRDFKEIRIANGKEIEIPLSPDNLAIDWDLSKTGKPTIHFKFLTEEESEKVRERKKKIGRMSARDISTEEKYRLRNFSSSIQKAVSMLKSSDFSEAKFNKFMRENSWQVI